MHCGKCGVPLLDGHEFCTGCGVKKATNRADDSDVLNRAYANDRLVVMDCTHCRATPSPMDRYCTGCGGAVPEPEIDRRPRCSKCERFLLQGERYCGDCGGQASTPTESPTSSPTRSPMSWGGQELM